MSIGRLTPVMISTWFSLKKLKDRLEGVPPNMSVKMITPLFWSTRLRLWLIFFLESSTSSYQPIEMASMLGASPRMMVRAFSSSSAMRPWQTMMPPIMVRARSPGQALLYDIPAYL